MKRKRGWDERDYKLWSEIQALPSYMLLPNKDKAISLKQVVNIMEKQAGARQPAKRGPHAER